MLVREAVEDALARRRPRWGGGAGPPGRNGVSRRARDVDLLAGDVDLDRGQGELAHGRQRLERRPEPPVGPVDAALGVLALDKGHSLPRTRTRSIAGLVQAQG